MTRKKHKSKADRLHARQASQQARQRLNSAPTPPGLPTSFDPFGDISPQELEKASRRAQASPSKTKVGATRADKVAPKQHQPIFHIARQGPADAPSSLQAEALEGFIPHIQQATYHPFHFIGISPLPWAIPTLHTRGTGL